MSYWNAEKQEVVRIAPEAFPGYPTWQRIDCGCCAGIEWGGEYPVECTTCGGSGFIAKHIATGTLALWPGGSICGRDFGGVNVVA